MINYSKPCTNYPTDKIFLTSHWSFTMANVLASYYAMFTVANHFHPFHDLLVKDVNSTQFFPFIYGTDSWEDVSPIITLTSSKLGSTDILIICTSFHCPYKNLLPWVTLGPCMGWGRLNSHQTCLRIRQIVQIRSEDARFCRQSWLPRNPFLHLVNISGYVVKWDWHESLW